MKKITCCTIIFSFLFAFVINAAEMRTWTSGGGSHKTEAEFVKISDDGKIITIRWEDGKEKDIPLDKLSKADQEYVKKQTEKKLVEQQTAVTPLITDELEKELDALKNKLEVSQKRHSDYATQAQLKGRSFDRYSAALPLAPQTKSVYQEYTRARQQEENEAKVIERLKKQIDELETKLNAQQLADLTNNVPSKPLSTANLPTEQEKALLRKKIDAVNLRDNGELYVELSEEEKEGVIQFLHLAEKTLKEKYSESGLSLIIMRLGEYKSKNGASLSYQIKWLDKWLEIGRLKVDKIDAYLTCLAAYEQALKASAFSASRGLAARDRQDARSMQSAFDAAGLSKSEADIVLRLLTECNRLSGNAHDEEEKARLGLNLREDEKKKLFSNSAEQVNDSPTPQNQVQFTAAEQAEINKFSATYGNNVRSVDNNGETLLHKATQQGSVAVVKFLISEGANVNAKSKYGWTPLHDAANKNYVEIAEHLVSQKANINAKGQPGESPLHFAADKGSINVAQFLLSKGANINAKTNHNSTPLHYAAGAGRIEIAKFLVTNKADVNAKDKDGKTPLDGAKRKASNDAMVQYLMSVGGR